MSKPTTTCRDYPFHTADASHMAGRIMPVIFELAGQIGPGFRVLDVGCGNGYVASLFLEKGCTVVGIDLSESGIALARSNFPAGRFELLGAEEPILGQLGEAPFDLVVSTEVIEHLYSPKSYVRGCFEALRPGGMFICSTPYHGYLKNLLIALMGGWDRHADPLWDGGHIKFWNRRTLAQVFTEAGFEPTRFRGVGRVSWLWMSMIMAGRKPTGGGKERP